jgi:hypothetical protein
MAIKVKAAPRAFTSVVGREKKSISQINAAVGCNISTIPAADAAIRGNPVEMRLQPIPEQTIPYPIRTAQVLVSGIANASSDGQTSRLLTRAPERHTQAI